jgi:Putative transposase
VTNSKFDPCAATSYVEPPQTWVSRVFRSKFLALLRSAFDRGRLTFHGKLAPLADPREFQLQLAASVQTEWVVYAKPPWGGPEQVLKYLSRYTHRVAISNQRLVDLENGDVRFRWKDYAHQGATKTMKLRATEFIRRFLLHVLPLYVVRIRHYGFLANRVCQEKLARCRSLLSVDATSEPLCTPKEPVEGQSTATLCPSCGKGRMVMVEMLRPLSTH